MKNTEKDAQLDVKIAGASLPDEDIFRPGAIHIQRAEDPSTAEIARFVHFYLEFFKSIYFLGISYKERKTRQNDATYFLSFTFLQNRVPSRFLAAEEDKFGVGLLFLGDDSVNQPVGVLFPAGIDRTDFIDSIFVSSGRNSSTTSDFTIIIEENHS